MKKLLFSALFLLIIISGYGQTKDITKTGFSFTLDQPLDPDNIYDYTATEFVKLTGDFGYEPYSGNSFHAITDPLMVIPPEIDTTIGPTGNNNGGVVGSIPGDFSISGGGSATYSIPLSFPTGTNGHKPNLSLAYSSTGGDGIICDGWSLQGISVISRYPKSYYYNDTAQTVMFSNYDEFVLNGQHLIKINDNEYRTENESFNKIVPIDEDVNNGFIVFHSNGVITKYGSGSNSRQLLQDCPYPIAWYADTIFDPFKNYINIEYYNDVNSGYVCPKYVNYTGNMITGTNTYYRIEFVYEDKTNTPKLYFYNENPLYHGIFSQVKKRLVSVQCNYLPTMEMITEYQLNYKQEGIFNKHFLASVSQYDAEGNHLNPTLFEWKHSGYDVDLLNNEFMHFDEGANETTTYLSSDFNQDGTDDLIHYWRNMDYLIDSFSIHMGDDHQGYYSISPEFTYRFDFPVVTFQTGDFNGDGVKDIFYVYLQYNKYKSKIMFMEYDETTHSFTYTESDVIFSLTESVYLDPTFIIGDFTGNGIMDCAVLYEPTGAIYSKLFFFTSTINNPLSGFVSDGANQTYEWEYFFARDYDGDHKTDLLIITESNAKVFKLTNNNQMITSYNCPDSFANINGKISSGDFNSDGKSDILILTYDSINNVKIYNSFGKGFVEAPVQTIENMLTGFGIPEVIDLNGDGFEDLAMIKIINSGTNYRELIRIDYLTSTNGRTFLPGDTISLINLGNSIINQNFIKYTWCENNNPTIVDMVCTYFDINTLDNFGVRVFSDEANCNYNAISKITNGFGEQIKVYFEQIDNYDEYTRGTEESYPVWMLSRGMTVVSQYHMETGSGDSTYITKLKYKGAKYHRFGKGFLGFDELTFVNESNGKTTTTYYSHNNPYYHVQTDSIKNWLTSSTTLINRITKSYQFHDFGNKRYFPYTSSTISEKFGLDGQLNDYTLQTKTQHLNSQDLPYRIEENTQKTMDDEWVNKYSDISLLNLTTGSKWILGLQDTIQTTHTSYDDDPIYRITTKEYYNQTGAVKKTTIEPDNPMKKIASYQYDDFGNITQTKLSATGLTDRINTKSYSDDGRFVSYVINALGHITQYQYYDNTGMVKTLIDPNQKTTTYFYNGFGQKITTLYPDNKQTQNRLLWASGHPDAPIIACYYSWEKTSGTPETIIFYDKLNRVLRKVTIAFDGRKIYTDQQYYYYNYKVGLKHKVSNPYFAQNTPYYTLYTYDALRRKSTVTAPDGIITNFDYGKKQVTTTITAGNETRIKKNKLDAAGRLSCSQDLVNNISVYNNYYSNGLVKEKWTGANSNAKISYYYDIFGNLDTIIDPNMGMTVKTYNAFGELVAETDANNNTISFVYDLLGRTTNRIEEDAITNWHYDTQQNGIGKIHYSTCNYVDKNGDITLSRDEYFYDALGRQTRSEKTINGETFVTENTRDIYGRIKKTIYPSGYTTKNHYNKYAYLGKISNPDAGTIWEATQMNSVGNLEAVRLGNSIHTNYTYQADNFRITSIQSGKDSPNELQNLHYQWFEIGNLDYREDQNRNLTENFVYDDLDRLKNSYLNNIQQQEQQYHDNGNISYKNDIGNYQYDPSGSKPNAVSTITEPSTGMLNLPDQEISYTSFHKIAKIVQGNTTLNMAYGGDHNRIIQNIDYGNGSSSTKTYIGSMYEKIENSDGTIKELNYLVSPGGVFGILTIDGQGNESISYLLKDHLNSITAVLDKNGNIVEEINYNAWGCRRNPQDWSYNNVPASTLFDRGYTGHEHLDAFGLINMNGRVYDPFVARFLSPDPIIQDSENSQNYNGYSYCLNNPLKYTDPSGYSFWSVIGESIDRGLNKAVNILTSPARLVSTIGRPGYFNADYILNSEIPGPGSPYYFYMPVQGSEFRYTFWPSGTGPGFYRGNDGSETMGGGSRWNFQYRTKIITIKIKEGMIEEGDFNNMDILAFLAYDSSLETPGMSFTPQENENGDETEEEKKGQDGGGDGLSTKFIAGTTWTGFVAGSKKGYNIINNEAIRQGHYNNSIRKPGVPLDDVTSIKVPNSVKIIGKYGGLVFTFYGAYDIDQQWRNSEISTGTMMIEQISNSISAIPAYGTGWSIGWNLGKYYGPSTWYGTNDDKWFE